MAPLQHIPPLRAAAGLSSPPGRAATLELSRAPRTRILSTRSAPLRPRAKGQPVTLWTPRAQQCVTLVATTQLPHR